VWFYRRTMWHKPRDIVMQGVLPGLGGVLLVGAFIWSSKTYLDPDYGYTSIGGIGGVFLLGVGSLLLGVVLMLVWQAISPAYFRGETLTKRDATELVLAPGPGSPTLRLPDSVESTVIAADLSNLPLGEVAVDPVTGRTYGREKDEDGPEDA
jgi:hypothetical protein